jgi:hypothetical protein
MDNITIIPLENPREYILSHNGLSQFKESDYPNANNISFQKDLEEGKLNDYAGTYVLYWKGILTGQSRNGDKLIEKAKNYYGSSNLKMFEVESRKKFEKLNEKVFEI